MLASAIASGVVLGAIYALVAVGLALIFGVVKIINFAQGALLTVALYGVYLMYSHFRIDPYLTLPAVVAGMAALGCLIQTVLIDRVLHKERASQLLITFGLAMALQNGCLALFGADYHSVNTPIDSQVIHPFGVAVTVVSLVAIGGSALSVAFLYLFLRKTRVGTAIRVVAQQPDSAELAGINVRRMYALAFALGCALAAAAAMLIGIGQSVFATMINVQMSTAFVFLVFIVLMIARPNGLFGRTERV